MKKNLTKIAAVASLATVLTPVVASANTVSTDVDHALRLEQTAHADGTQNDRVDYTGVTNSNLKDSGGYVYGAGTKVARSKQQGNYWLYLAETGTGVVHYGEVPEQFVTPTGQVTNHLDDYGSTVIINNSLRSNDSMAGELTPTDDPATQTGSNNNYQEGNNGSASSSSQAGSSSSSEAQPGSDATSGSQSGASSSSEAKPSDTTSGSQTQKPGANTSSEAKPSTSTGSTSSSSQTGNASSSSEAKPGSGATSGSQAGSSSQAQPGHNVSGNVTGIDGNHDNGGATNTPSTPSQKPAAGQTSQAKPAGDKTSSSSQASTVHSTNDKQADGVKANATKTDAHKATAGHHVVAAGETLSGIAKANNTTVGAIVKANPSITNPANIKVGTDLVMPGNNNAVQAQNVSTAKAAPAATTQRQGSQAKANEKTAPAKGELLKTGAQDNEKDAVIASMAAVGGLVGLAALNRKKKFNY